MVRGSVMAQRRRTRQAVGNPAQAVLPIVGVLYDPRFLETHAGPRILNDPRIAVVELVANAWDAGATKVQIAWPDAEVGVAFSIEDNGTGLTNTEFRRRWRSLS